MKTKLKFIILIVIAVIAIIIAALCINFTPQERADVSSLMSTAQKYLIENQYEQAIAEFSKVIEIEPKNVDAYIGLAEAYVGMGDTNKAIEVLEKGYEITGDERLKNMIDMIDGLTDKAVENSGSVSGTEITTVFSEITTEEVVTTTYAKITVPNLAGLSKDEAIKLCENAGLKYSISESDSDSVKNDFVISQQIPAGAEVDERTTFVFTVSTGVKVTATETTTTTTVPVTTTTVPITTTPVPSTDATTNIVLAQGDNVRYLLGKSFNGLKWEMTIDDVIKKLSLKDSEYELRRGSYGGWVLAVTNPKETDHIEVEYIFYGSADTYSDSSLNNVHLRIKYSQTAMEQYKQACENDGLTLNKEDVTESHKVYEYCTYDERGYADLIIEIFWYDYAADEMNFNMGFGW